LIWSDTQVRAPLRAAGCLCIVVAFAIGFIDMPTVRADTPPPPELSLRGRQVEPHLI
jgi:hypothetical protein